MTGTHETTIDNQSAGSQIKNGKMNMDSKAPAFDFSKVRKLIRLCRWYMEDIYVVPFWNHANGEEANEGEGEPAGLWVREKKQIYYMASRWPNRNGNDDDAIILLALKPYCTPATNGAPTTRKE